MGFWNKLLGREGNDSTVTDFQRATAAPESTTFAAAGAVVGQLAGATDSSFRLVVEDVFFITGRGTVVTGTVESGSVAVGDRVEIADPTGRTRACAVKGIEMFRKQASTAVAGEAIGLLLNGVEQNDVARGSVISLR